jgi:hypothetical protein
MSDKVRKGGVGMQSLKSLGASLGHTKGIEDTSCESGFMKRVDIASAVLGENFPSLRNTKIGGASKFLKRQITFWFSFQ